MIVVMVPIFFVKLEYIFSKAHIPRTTHNNNIIWPRSNYTRSFILLELRMILIQLWNTLVFEQVGLTLTIYHCWWTMKAKCCSFDEGNEIEMMICNFLQIPWESWALKVKYTEPFLWYFLSFPLIYLVLISITGNV